MQRMKSGKNDIEVATSEDVNRVEDHFRVLGNH